MAQTLGSVAVGTIVKLNENGSPGKFYVAKQNYESGLNSAGRTLLVRVDCYDRRAWNRDEVNAYAGSDLDSWFNNTYKSMLDADIRSLIGTTKFYYTPGDGIWDVVTLERSVFALSGTELGKSAAWFNVEGSPLPIASTLYTEEQWTRTPYRNYTSQAAYLDTNGNIYGARCIATLGARPAFTLPSSLYVRDDGSVSQNTAPSAPGSINVPPLAIVNSSVSITWMASTDPEGNLSGYRLQRSADGGSWTQIYQGANLSYTDTAPLADSLQYRVQAYDTDGLASGWTTSASIPAYGYPTLTVPLSAMRGQNITATWTAVNGADSYTLQRKANTDADWVQVYSGAALTFTETAGTWTSVQYRVQAVFDGTPGGWAMSASIPVVSASALVISGTDEDLGSIVNDIPFYVLSDQASSITVEITVNGALMESMVVENGSANVISIIDLPTGEGSITIKATITASGGQVSETRNWTYTKTPMTFSDGGGMATLSQDGKTIFPKTLAEAVRMPGGVTLDRFIAATVITLTTSAWTQSGGVYTQTVDCPIVWPYAPIVIVEPDLTTEDQSADDAVLAAWQSGPGAKGMKQGDGEITFYSASQPTMNIPVRVGVI